MRDAAPVSTRPRVLPPNDPRQYDDLADEWWRPDGAFAMLHWLARARAALVPPASGQDALLVDLGCGAGLLAPHLVGKGYRHVGVDLTRSALVQAAAHGVTVLNGDATAVPLADRCADVVSAGELLEHLPDWRRAVAEACRLLRPGGLLVLDTLNDTLLARLVAVEIGERLPTVPRGIHDPRLFVDSRALVAEAARHGVELRLRGVRPAFGGTLAWLLRRMRATDRPRGAEPRIVPTWSTAVLYQGRGVKSG
ncbi:methyltransferase domain-containing protein [Micromonospora auratinigra]|uniref:2-polyprenyl-6-hydroxyphenyl methylase / 3-demethylubiquinone-9 3-methyltransferase n=1 Tax=Micromonospora auratinigra TaxID=261654 RepID=A0A1A8ZY90_9ACTN|nr:methyltransferase domain-containing protein [Micromonospora auratinigra]SBT48849.1 2-polyprenyl-6-hydroxyphenyl methylase / 3-demethylubiquinone-9 3-methyltransferase [Micromonospora auratinigra]